MRVKLQAVKKEFYRRMHHSVTEQGTWLRAVVQGYFNYHAIPGNIHALKAFRREVARLWHRTLQRRSQHDRTSWARMNLLLGRWLPNARILHPYPVDRFFVTHPR